MEEKPKIGRRALMGRAAAGFMLMNTVSCASAAANFPPDTMAAAVGITVSPTSSSTAWTDLPEMTSTIITLGNKVLITFTGMFSCDTPGEGGYFQLMRGATVIAELKVAFAAVTVTSQHSVGFSYFDTQAAGTYTYKIQWQNSLSGITVWSVGIQRVLQVENL